MGEWGFEKYTKIRWREMKTDRFDAFSTGGRRDLFQASLKLLYVLRLIRRHDEGSGQIKAVVVMMSNVCEQKKRDMHSHP